MTLINTEHPAGIPYLEFTENGRKISFEKECLGNVRIYRRVHGEEEYLLADNIRTPFTDNEDFPPGSVIIYRIELDYGHDRHQYSLEAREAQ